MMKKVTLSLAFLLTLLVLALYDGGASTALASAKFQFLSPLNDDFADATVISGLPFDNTVDVSSATLEAGEAVPFCAQGSYSFSKTIWYRFTPISNSQLTAYSLGDYWGVLSVYKGTDWNNLTALGCRGAGNFPFSFAAEAGSTYYFQIGAPDFVWSLGLHLEVTPPPIASFFTFQSDPSVFDTVQFNNNSFDPAGAGFQSTIWSFGDGTSSTLYSPSHQYAADGDYNVSLTVTTTDGRTNSYSQMLQVRTHDVAILKFVRPKSGREGETAKLSVGVNSKRYAELVEVTLYKSVPGGCCNDGFEQVGNLRQTVIVKPGTKTTDFLFSYTFTAADAAVGKVTFKAVANIVNARDILPADNTQTTLPISVSSRRSGGAQVVASDASEAGWVDDVSHTDVANLEEEADAPSGASQLFIPIAINRD